ncbi:MAG: MoaD/ThiS family protein [Deltaproteobacteria bacterium]|nr:MoaD/ThiS family protein [Deltaproteobacteria bacterium]
MKITIEFLGLPNLSGVLGKKSEIEFPGGTVSDLTSYLIRRYGPKVRQMLLDSDGQMDSTIQVMINDDGFLPRHQFSEKSLNENDIVSFLLLAGGG